MEGLTRRIATETDLRISRPRLTALAPLTPSVDVAHIRAINTALEFVQRSVGSRVLRLSKAAALPQAATAPNASLVQLVRMGKRLNDGATAARGD